MPAKKKTPLKKTARKGRAPKKSMLEAQFQDLIDVIVDCEDAADNITPFSDIGTTEHERLVNLSALLETKKENAFNDLIKLAAEHPTVGTDILVGFLTSRYPKPVFEALDTPEEVDDLEDNEEPIRADNHQNLPS